MVSTHLAPPSLGSEGVRTRTYLPSYPVVIITGLSIRLAPLSPGSLEKHVLCSGEKRRYLSNFLDSTGGDP